MTGHAYTPGPAVLVSIDPGLRNCGVGVFRNGTLERAALVRNPEKTQRGPVAWRAMAKANSKWIGDVHPDVLIIEHMQVYGARHRKGDQDDLLQLVGVAAATFMRLDAGAYVSVVARVWKKSVPQQIMANRILGKISDEERAVIEPCPASKLHDVAHGIGLGLWHLGRLGP